MHAVSQLAVSVEISAFSFRVRHGKSNGETKVEHGTEVGLA